MNEHDMVAVAVAPQDEASPYRELKQLIENELARAAHQPDTQPKSTRPTTQPSDASRPAIRYGLD